MSRAKAFGEQNKAKKPKHCLHQISAEAWAVKAKQLLTSTTSIRSRRELAMTVTQSKPMVWMPTRIHPKAMAYALQVFDVITPQDARANDWPELCVASIVRTGRITREEAERAGRAGKVKIFARNGALPPTASSLVGTDKELSVCYIGVGYDMIPIDI